MTELSLIERIQNNDSTLTELRLTEAPVTYCNPSGSDNKTLTELFTALCQNTVIEYVRIDRDFLPCMINNTITNYSEDNDVHDGDSTTNNMNNKYETIELFFIALGSIVSLKEVHIWHAAFPVTALFGFLNSQKQELEVLEFGCLELTGTTNDFHLIAQSISSYHTTLHTFHMIDFVINTTDTITIQDELSNTMNGDDTERTNTQESTVVSSLDEIVLAVGNIPTIEVIKIEVTASRRRSLCGPIESLIQPKLQLSGTTIASVLLSNKSTSLQELIVTRIPFTYDDYKILSSALSSISLAASKKLKVLALPHCNVTDDVCSLLCPSLSINTTLETLDLSCNKITDTGCILIASALKSYNNTTTSNDNNNNNNNNNETTTTGSKIKVLKLWGNIKISTDGYNALLEMLQSNCYLQRIPLMAPYEYGQKIDIALLKNRISTINTNIANVNANNVGSDSNNGTVVVSVSNMQLPMKTSTPSSPIKKLGMTTNRAA